MRRLMRIAGMILLLLLTGAGSAYLWRNPETATLDAEARTGASGRFVTLSDGITHYDVSGPDTGRVAVLVHGFSVPYYIWDSTAVALGSAGYRVVRYDVFGRGLSDRPDTAYDGALYDRQLRELLDSLQIRGPIDLMGLSYGGYITSHFTVGNAQRVRTLTLIDPVTTSPAVPPLLSAPVLGHWFWQMMQAPTAADGQASDFLHPERWPDWADRYRPQMRYRGFGRALRRSAIHSSRTDYPGLYTRVGTTGIPVLLVWGKQDATVSIATSTVVRSGIRNLEYVVVDSSGHLPHMEQASIVHTRMLDFLQRHPPSVASAPAP
ncbi:MAG: alpha/beta hydrolase [Gemmatimonadaceae bacterium]|nr:alpha/beta hydrolase [Gemmatimonadaceae bacterium]